MRQTKLVLTDEDRTRIGEISAKGTRQVREVKSYLRAIWVRAIWGQTTFSFCRR